MSKSIQIKVEHNFKAPAEKVFDAWLKPELARKWMSLIEFNGCKADVRTVEIDARVGGKFKFSDIRNGEEAISWGYYKVIDRPTKLVFTWFASEEDEKDDNSVVTIDITPKGTGCLVELTYVMDSKWADYTTQTENGWRTMLGKINDLYELHLG